MAPSPGEAETEPVAAETVADVQADSSPPSSPDSKAESSTAADSKPTSMLDAVKTAVAKDKAAESSTATTRQEGEPEKPGSDEDEELPDPTQDELNRFYTSRTRKRIRRLIDQRDTAQKEVASYKGRAEQFDQLVTYVQQAGLTPQKIDFWFEAGRQFEHEPLKALETLLPVVRGLQQRVGAVLPPDLAQQVQTGHVPEPTAAEIARLRAQQAENERLRGMEQQRMAEAQAQANQRLVGDVQNGVAAWETRWKTSDPDFAAKSPLFQDKMKLALLDAKDAGRLPRSVEEAVALAEKVKLDTERALRVFRPARQPTTPNPDSSGSLATSAAQPTSWLEAVKLGARASA